MKASLFLIIISLSTLTYAQNLEIGLTENGILSADKVENFPNLSATELYSKTHDWVAYTFRNLESVKQSFVEDKMIRIQGISPKSVSIGIISYDLEYEIQIDFKDEKLRFTVNNFKYFSDPLVKNELKDGLYKLNGQPRTNGMANTLRESTNQEINNIYNSLIKSIVGEGTDDDW